MGGGGVPLKGAFRMGCMKLEGSGENSTGLSQWHTELSLAPLPRDLPNKTILGRSAGTAQGTMLRPGPVLRVSDTKDVDLNCKLPGCYGNNMIGSRRSFDSRSYPYGSTLHPKLASLEIWAFSVLRCWRFTRTLWGLALLQPGPSQPPALRSLPTTTASIAQPPQPHTAARLFQTLHPFRVYTWIFTFL